MSHAAKVVTTGRCERVVVTTQDGRRFDLGPPDSMFFGIRLFIYKLRRRRDLNEV